jgi:hypothetical protein
MRHPNFSQNPSFTNDLNAIAGLYRTVFWMMGRKARYGRIWPPEADMGPPDEAVSGTAPQAVMEGSRSQLVEVGSRD